MSRDTIFALSSGLVPSGVAIVRFSGPSVRFAFETMIGIVPTPRQMVLSDLKGQYAEVLDRCLIVFFPGPNSFTGEDCGEFHIHGSRAVLDSVLSFMGKLDGFRLADPGEFSRRAFENGRLDLTEIEGLSDLIRANTDTQRKLALSQSSGELRLLYDDWRIRLIKLRAYLEAGFDFSEEEDIPEDILNRLSADIEALIGQISKFLETAATGEIIRDGFKVSLVGAPNSGKSSLLNALARRDVAIVSEIAGTTRDIVSVSLNLNGYEVIVSDTAGVHDTDDLVENMGIERTLVNAGSANLVLILTSVDAPEFDISDIIDLPGSNCVSLNSKIDLVDNSIADRAGLGVSALTGVGLTELEQLIVNAISDRVNVPDGAILTRLRQKLLLDEALIHLMRSLNFGGLQNELVTEELRLTGDLLGKIVGRIDVEDLLDVIFAEFCIGK